MANAVRKGPTRRTIAIKESRWNSQAGEIPSPVEAINYRRKAGRPSDLPSVPSTERTSPARMTAQRRGTEAAGSGTTASMTKAVAAAVAQPVTPASFARSSGQRRNLESCRCRELGLHSFNGGKRQLADQQTHTWYRYRRELRGYLPATLERFGNWYPNGTAAAQIPDAPHRQGFIAATNCTRAGKVTCILAARQRCRVRFQGLAKRIEHRALDPAIGTETVGGCVRD